MWLCLLINTSIVILCVLVHYGFLAGVLMRLDNPASHNKLYLLVHVFSGLVAHIIEIFLFATAYYLMLQHLQHLQVGFLEGDFDGSFFDCFYFSFTTYTSLGFGDIEPEGWIRFTVGIEALIGLMMITWTASLLYLVMQRLWSTNKDH